MSRLNDLKEQAKKDMVNSASGELGFAEMVVDGKTILVTAKKVGANQPGRKENIRYKITQK